MRELRCGVGEEAGILRLTTRGMAVDNITARTVQVKLSAALDLWKRGSVRAADITADLPTVINKAVHQCSNIYQLSVADLTCLSPAASSASSSFICSETKIQYSAKLKTWTLNKTD